MTDQQWGFTFHEAACVQCHACEAACKAWRGVEAGVKWRWVSNIWHGQYPDLKSSGITVVCQHCAEPACISACPAGAIQKRDTDGIVLVHSEQCIGCQACLAACPFGVPQFDSKGIMQKCDLCVNERLADCNVQEITVPPCVASCPTGAIGLRLMASAEKEATEARLEKALRQD
ncbi:MAG: 4Fe-4S dicluster domain-containing protein [Saccharofermentanales bacterium]|jgi:anaerobic dimethyl sulfoxide reductase subunit B (iron-sulfur subunit)|nr:4Fe-4S binding protein [Clostridiaceae bacterium]